MRLQFKHSYESNFINTKDGVGEMGTEVHPDDGLAKLSHQVI